MLTRQTLHDIGGIHFNRVFIWASITLLGFGVEEEYSDHMLCVYVEPIVMHFQEAELRIAAGEEICD